MQHLTKNQRSEDLTVITKQILAKKLETARVASRRTKYDEVLSLTLEDKNHDLSDAAREVEPMVFCSTVLYELTSSKKRGSDVDLISKPRKLTQIRRVLARYKNSFCPVVLCLAYLVFRSTFAMTGITLRTSCAAFTVSLNSRSALWAAMASAPLLNRSKL